MLCSNGIQWRGSSTKSAQRRGAGPLTRSRKRASRSRTPTRELLSPTATLTRCCTSSMSTDDGIDLATTSAASSDGTTSRSCTNDPSSSSPSSIDRMVAPTRRASATRSSSCSGAASGATTNTVSSRRAASSLASVTDRCAGASGGGDQRTRVGDSSGTPANRDSSSRCAARCHGSSVGVPTSSRPPTVVLDLRSVLANSWVRSTQPLVPSSSRSACTRSASTGPCCPSLARAAVPTRSRLSGRCGPRRGTSGPRRRRRTPGRLRPGRSAGRRTA
jgi:hypothetical protein